MKSRLLLKLFSNFFKISLFVVGGGFAMVPAIEEVFVKKYNLLTKEDILDMISVTQTLPGLIAVNSAIFVGQKLAGLKGAIVATVGVVLPSFIIILLIASLFSTLDFSDLHVLKAFSCIRASVCALFLMVLVKLFKSFDSKIDYLIIFVLLIALFLNASPIFVILTSILIGYFCKYLKKDSTRETNG